VLGYAVWLAFQRAWLGLLPTLAISVSVLSQAFRYHFWLFQIKTQKLGCTLNDWFQAHFRGRPLL
jgi:intracellular multiplication protein IcmV